MPPADRPGPRYLTIPECAALLRLHSQTCYRLAAAGQLPAVRVGRKLLVDGRRLEAMLERQLEEQGGQATGRRQSGFVAGGK